METGMLYKVKEGLCPLDCFNCKIVNGNKLPCFMYNVMETLKELQAENTALKQSINVDPLQDVNTEICVGQSPTDEIVEDVVEDIVQTNN